MKTILKTVLLAGCSLCASLSVCHASLTLNTVGVASTINFDTTVSDVNNGQFTGVGFQSVPTSGQLDSDSWAVTGFSDGNLAFGGSATTGDYARGSSGGGVTTGGIYGFDVDPGAGVNRALGIQPGGSDWAPGTLTLKIQNQTGQTLTDLILSYIVYVRNDQARANSFNFSYSTDNTLYTALSALNLTSTEVADASPSFVANNRNTTITGLSIANNGLFYLRWNGADVSGSGSRDEFALDDISVTGMAAVPEASTWVAGLGLSLGMLGSYLRKYRK